MKLHYQLRRDNDTYLSEVIKQYNDIVPKVLCEELIEFFEESITFRVDDHRKQATEMQKRMALSKTEAYALRTEITIAAGQSGDMAINSERVMKAFGTLQAQLGTTSKAIAGMAVDAAVMQEKLGLSDEAIGNAGKSSILLGKSMKDNQTPGMPITPVIKPEDIMKQNLGLMQQPPIET